jgi:hypothetical protein
MTELRQKVFLLAAALLALSLVFPAGGALLVFGALSVLVVFISMVSLVRPVLGYRSRVGALLGLTVSFEALSTSSSRHQAWEKESDPVGYAAREAAKEAARVQKEAAAERPQVKATSKPVSDSELIGAEAERRRQEAFELQNRGLHGGMGAPFMYWDEDQWVADMKDFCISKAWTATQCREKVGAHVRAGRAASEKKALAKEAAEKAKADAVTAKEKALGY